MTSTTTAGNVNVALLRAAFDALNRRDLDACTRLMAEDFRINLVETPHQKRGLPAWRRGTESLLAAFPDLQVQVEDIFGTDDKVAVRLQLTGTHRGEFLGNQPTGRTVQYRSHEVYRFADGKIAEEWICSDMMTLMGQVGAFSRHRLLTMWLAGHRVWLALALGLLAGFLAALAA